MDKQLTPTDVSDIQVKATDGKTYQAKWDGVNLTVVESATPPPPKPQPIMGKSFKQSDKQDGKKQEKGGGVGASKYEDKQKPNKGAVTPKLPKLDDTVFRARLSSIMTDNKYDRRLRGRTRGKLDMTRLFKAQTRSTAVFAQKEARKNKEYNITLLVDVSGSMRDGNYNDTGDYVTRIDKASEAVVFLTKNFVGMNIRVRVLSFNHFGRIEVNWDEPIKDYNDLRDRLCASAQSGNNGAHCNHDYDAMAYAYSTFPKKGKNILIMLSDGEPAGCYDETDGTQALKRFSLVNKTKLTKEEREDKQHIHSLVKHNSHVESIGIGIQRGGWQIPDHKVVNNLAELKPVMIEMLKKKIKRG